MKLTTSFRQTIVSLSLLVGATRPALGCGPYAPIIPTPEFFRLPAESHTPISYYERQENLYLWQSLTSERIPLSDIEEAVYHDSWNVFTNRIIHRYEKSGNLFYTYLKNSNDTEITDFLSLAKWLEERRQRMCSPWYYPRNRQENRTTGDFCELIEQCRKYKGKRLRDRYALQVSRALFASRQYAACIVYSDSAFAGIPQNNLMKRMAQRYVAGCWSRLGETRRADSIFAQVGDIESVSARNPAKYMARYNPDAPQLMEYIRRHASDTLFMQDMEQVARHLLKNRKVKYNGDWYYLLSYIHNEFYHDTALARKEIYRALHFSFSTDELKDLARAYKMKLDAQNGNSRTLLADLRWMDGNTDLLNPDAKKWVRRCRNIIYVDWIPLLWKKKDYSTAILLCAYADNLAPTKQCNEDSDYDYCDYDPVRFLEHGQPLPLLRSVRRHRNHTDYGSLSFQLMGSLSSMRLAATYRRIMGSNPLYKFLRQKTRTERSYYYELIGTLALREGNYARAENYLSQVSIQYLKTMNINRDGYLSRNPFFPYRSRWRSSYEADLQGECAVGNHNPESDCNAKITFARKMRNYKHAMTHGRTADERGLARLMYAIGRRNSFEECWALTQYWRGTPIGIFEPILQYWENDYAHQHYSFLYNYYATPEHASVEKNYREELEASLAMLITDEAKAKAHYILGHLATVVKHYGNTPTGQLIKTSCDQWKSWL